MLGFTEVQFYTMRPAAFFEAMQQYNKKCEADARLMLETTRMQTTALINVQLKAEKQIKPKQLWQFPWEEENQVSQQVKQLSADEFNDQYLKAIKQSGLYTQPEE